MTSLTWPEIKRRLRGLRVRVEIERREHRRAGAHISADKRDLEIEALDAVLSIEPLDPKEPMG